VNHIHALSLGNEPGKVKRPSTKTAALLSGPFQKRFLALRKSFQPPPRGYRLVPAAEKDD
jgi:hypothetical protein